MDKSSSDIWIDAMDPHWEKAKGLIIELAKSHTRRVLHDIKAEAEFLQWVDNSSEYNKGYNKAIKDIIRVIETSCDD